MSRFVLGVLAGITAATAVGLGTAALAREHGWTLPGLGKPEREPGPVTVVLHRDGGRVTADDDDDPVRRTSGILQRQGIASTTLPGFRGSDAQWSALVRCVQERFDGYAVEIVDTPPTDGPYTLAFIGGTPDRLGYPDTVGGIAPHAHRVLERSVLFVFQPKGIAPRALCETTAHEIGHTLGLDHSRDCTDLMSYESCGEKEFRAHESACGEWEDRACEGGAHSQNAHTHLAAVVGLRPRTPAPPEPPRTETVVASRPRLQVRHSAEPTAGRAFSVSVDVGNADVRHVDLFWYARRGQRLRCGEPGPIDFSCRRDGSVYTFTLHPTRAGQRKFVARVTDAHGRLTRTPAYEVRLARP